MQAITGSFAMVPQALVVDGSVTDAALRAWCFIASWTPNKKDGMRYIFCSQLAEKMGIKERQVKRLTAQLCAAGWLLKEGDGGCNRPARYRPMQEKTLSSQDMVLEQNPVITGHGQSVNTLCYKTSVSVDPSRARNANAGDKNRFKLQTDFTPPEEWLIAAKQERAASGKSDLSPTEIKILVAKFITKKIQKGQAMDWDYWRRSFAEWYVREELPKNKKTVARKESVARQPAASKPIPATHHTHVESPPAPEMPTATPNPPESVNVAENADAAVTTPTPSTAPAPDLSELIKTLTRNTAMPRDMGYQPTARYQAPPAVPAVPDRPPDPARRARFMAQLKENDIPLPANCRIYPAPIHHEAAP